MIWEIASTDLVHFFEKWLQLVTWVVRQVKVSIPIEKLITKETDKYIYGFSKYALQGLLWVWIRKNNNCHDDRYDFSDYSL